MGETIRARRLALGLSQTALAKRLGVSHVSVCMWERDEARPAVKRLPYLAHALGTTVEALGTPVVSERATIYGLRREVATLKIKLRTAKHALETALIALEEVE
jgi:transcriptional regulator with XRE-family HTH domain